MDKKAITQICIILTIVLISGCTTGNKIGTPGEAKKVITVAALTHDSTISDFSSRGPTRWGYSKPDVSAPGVDNIAARAQGTSMGTAIGSFYTKASGTSMATPQVAGASAILIQAYEDIYGTKPSPAAIKAALMKSADDLYVDGLPYVPLHQGAGLINIEKAIDLISTLTPYMASSPDMWYPKKLTSLTDRETNLGEPMFLPGLLPGDFIFQKFLIIPSQSLPNIEIKTTTQWLTMNGNQELSLGNLNENEQPEFIAWLNIPSDAEPGSYNEKIIVYSDSSPILNIPVRIKIAAPLGEVTDKLEFTAEAAPETKYYAFSIPPNSYLLELNISSACEHMNAYLYGPSLRVYDFEDVDYYHDSTKTWNEPASTLSDIITISNPSSGSYTLALSNYLWGTKESYVQPLKKCDAAQVEGAIRVYSAKITPLSIRAVVEEETEQIHEMKIENNGAEINNINISTYCGDKLDEKTKGTYLLEYQEILNVNNGNFAGHEGYITEIPVEIVHGTRTLFVDVSQVGDHPTCAELYGPDNHYLSEACNSPLEEAPRTTNSLSFRPLIKPKAGEWTLKIFNGDWYEYSGGEEEVLVEINREIGLPCDSIDITPAETESISTNQESVLEAAISYPSKVKEGEITISTPKKDFTIGLTIIPKKVEKQGKGKLGVDKEAWNYLWLNIPTNAETSNLMLEKSSPGSEITIILNAELTEDIGSIKSIVLPETTKKYTQGKEIKYDYWNGINGKSNTLELLTDQDNDGVVQIIDFSRYDYLKPVTDTDDDGTIEIEYTPYWFWWVLTEDDDNDGYLTTKNDEALYVDELSPLNEYGLGKIHLETIYDYIVPKSESGNMDVVYIDLDDDLDVTDEDPLIEGDEFSLEKRKFRVDRIEFYEDYDEGSLEISELKDIFVDDISPIDKYAADTGYFGPGITTLVISKDESGYKDEVYIDIDHDLDITNNDPLKQGGTFDVKDERYIVQSITETEEGIELVISKVDEVIVGDLSPVQQYAYTKYYLDKTYSIILPSDINNKFYAPIYIDFNENNDFTDETPVNIGDQITTFADYSIVLYDVDKEDDCDIYGCSGKRVYFGVESIEKQQKDESYELLTFSPEKDIPLILTKRGEGRLYLDLNNDNDLNDANEGPFYPRETLKIDDVYYKFTKADPITIEELSGAQEHNLKLDPVLWKLSVLGKSLDSDKGYTLIDEGIYQQTEYTVNIDNPDTLSLAEIVIQNLESTPPAVKNPIHYSVSVNDEEVDLREVEFFDKIDIASYLAQGENTIIISIKDEDNNPVEKNHRLYYHEVAGGEMELTVTTSHEQLPVEMDIELEEEINDFSELVITFESTNNHDEELELGCSLTIKDAKGSALDETEFSFALQPEDTYTEVFDEFGIQGDAADYYAIASCTYEKNKLTDVKKFTITKELPVRMSVLINKNVIVSDENQLTYEISITKLREQAISGTLEIIAENSASSTLLSEQIDLPFEAEEELELNLEEGNYDLLFRFTSEFGYEVEKTIPIAIISPDDSKDTDNDGTMDIFDDDMDDDGIPNEDDKLKGNLRNINSNIPKIKFAIDDNENLNRKFAGESEAVFRKDGKTLINFSYDFSSNELDLTKVEIKKHPDASHGSLMVNGIDVEKVVYVDDINKDIDSVCIKDSKTSFDDISSNCNSDDESLIICDSSSHGDYMCEDLGDVYKISGIRHSAIIEQASPPPDGGDGGDGGDSGGSGGDGGSSGGDGGSSGTSPGSTSGIFAKRINMDTVDGISLTMTTVSRVIITYNRKIYVLDIRGATKNFLTVLFDREARDISINKYLTFDLDKDKKPDIKVHYMKFISNKPTIVVSKMVEKKGKEVDVTTAKKDEPAPEPLPSEKEEKPAPEDAIEEKESSFNYLLFLLPLTIIIVFIVVASIILPKQNIYKKYSNLHKLEAYIINHSHKGYTKEQIKSSLKYSGWPDDVIEHVFHKLMGKK